MTRLRWTFGVLALAGLMPATPLQAAALPNYGDLSVFVPFVNAAAMSDPEASRLSIVGELVVGVLDGMAVVGEAD